MAFSLRSVLIIAALVAVTRVSSWLNGFSAPPRSLPRGLTGRGAQSSKGPVMDVEVKPMNGVTDMEPIPKPNGLNKTDAAEKEKRERVVAKTAATKKRVEEKKQRLQAEAAKSKSATSADESTGLKGFAAQARKMAEEARNEAASKKDDVEIFTAEAKESFFQLASVGLEALSGVPPLILAASGFVTIALVLALSSSKPTINTPPKVSSAAPTIVSVKPPAPVAPLPPVASIPSTPAPAPVPEVKVPSQPAPPVFKSTPSPWARGLADSAANTLRSIADGLPGAEQAVEDELPVVQSAIQWASGVNADNATQKVENEVLPVVGKAAEGALRLGLQIGAGGLDFVGKNLPAVEEALGKVVDKGLPLAQSALHDAASNARRVAAEGISFGDNSNPYLQGAASQIPQVLKATAGALDATADMAPAVTSAVGYVANAATPVAQAALSAASGFANDAANIPSSTVEGGVATVIQAAKEASKAAPDVANSAKEALSAAFQAKAPAEVTSGPSGL